MADNKNVHDGRDRSKVDSKDPSEVEYLHQQYPTLTHQQVLDAIHAAGPVRTKITDWIREKHGV